MPTYADWRKSPFLLPLLILFWFPFQPSFTYLESLPLCGAIPSNLAPGCSWTDLPFLKHSPVPPIPNSRPPGVSPNKLCASLRRHRDPGSHSPEHFPPWLCDGSRALILGNPHGWIRWLEGDRKKFLLRKMKMSQHHALDWVTGRHRKRYSDQSTLCFCVTAPWRNVIPSKIIALG
jgi:hypothetical protein